MIIDAHTHNHPYSSLGLSADTPDDFIEVLDHYGTVVLATVSVALASA